MNLQVNFAISGDSPMYQTIFRSILKTSSSVEDATRQVLTTWEGNPGDKLSQRTEAAKRWYSYFKNSGGSGKPSEQLPPEYKGKVKFPAINAQAHSGYPGNNYAWGNCTWYVYNREYQIGHVIASNAWALLENHRISNDEAFEHLGETFIQDMEKVDEALEELDQKIIEYHEAIKFNRDNISLSKIQSLQLEREELQDAYDDILIQFNIYDDIKNITDERITQTQTEFKI